MAIDISKRRNEGFTVNLDGADIRMFSAAYYFVNSLGVILYLTSGEKITHQQYPIEQWTVNGGVGVDFFLDDTKLIPAGSGPQTIPLETLLKSPSSISEITESVTLTTGNLTQVIARYMYNTQMGGTQIDGGLWVFNTYCLTNNVGGASSIPVTIRRVIAGAGTVTITGSGTSRTATVTGGTPFVAGDVNADMTLSGLLHTTTAVLRITGFTSSSVVTVQTLSTYTNQAGVAYSVHKFLFTDALDTIESTTVILMTQTSVQPAFAINVTDKISITYYGKSDTNNRSVTLYHNGTTHYSNFRTPLTIRHNDIAGLQGGTGTERYHLTLEQLNWIIAQMG
jgi:hypothetical protein